MTSLSDSQNIDVDRNSGNDHPPLPPGSPLQACPHCEALVDITEREPLEVVGCPGCGQQFAVTGQIENYQIVDVAGKGGMGVVYKAYDAGLDRNIALKLLKKSQSSDTQLIQQLETEAAVTASVTDSNVVRVYGSGRDRGRFFIAMELVDKGSLDDLIHLQGRVAEVQVLEVGIQIASGLKAAQQHGLIHRDVKPGNILFADAHTAKIVDFGLAIFMEQEESVRGEIWGTPYYVAPEKLDQEPEDFRSDMYSLGATLFHALAGRPPFEAENASLVALKHLKSQAVSLQAFAPWVSNPTAHIINRTLAKNPGDRFQSYDELIHNFRYALDQLHEHGNAPQQRARVVLETEEDRKGWTWVVLGMVAVIAILIGVVFVMKPKQNATAELAAEAAQPKARFLGEPIDALAGREKDAVEKFRTALEGNLSPTDRAWAQYLEGLAALSSNRTMDARNAFGKVEALAARIKDETLGKFLTESAARLSQGERFTANDVANLSRSNHELIGLLAAGLQNWQLGQVEDGVALLKQFRSAQPSQAYSWMKDLQPLSNGFVQELTEFEMELEKFKTAQPADRVALALELQKHSPVLVARAESVLKPFAKEIADQKAMLSRAPEPGIYRIINRQTGKSIDISGFTMGEGGALTQYDYQGQPNQLFELAVNKPGTYRLRPLHALTSVDVPDQKQDDGLELKTWTENDTAAQRWIIEPQGDGWHKIKSEASQKLMTAPGSDNSRKIVQMSDNGSLEQQWKFEPIGKRLNDGWFSTVIGARSPVDKAELDHGTFKITDQGPDMWMKNDKATFLMRSAQGDFDLVVRVASITKTNLWTKAGLMVRPALNPDRMNVAAIITPDNIASHQRRPANNNDTTSVKHPGQSVPHWLKIERRGNTFTTFHSVDGQKWNEMASDTLKMEQHLLVGVVVSSHDPAKPATAVFDNLTYTKK